MKIRNIHQASVFMLLGAHTLNCGIYPNGKYKGTVWIEFEEDANFKELMRKWQNYEFA